MHKIDPTQYDDLIDEAAQQQVEFDKWIEGKQIHFEEKMVKTITNKLGLNKKLSVVMQDVKDWGGKDAKLNFAWFHDTFPTFPVRLCTEQTVFAHNISVVDLYKRFTTTKMFKAFMEAKEFFPDTEQYNSWGLIFPWNGMGYAIIHNSSYVPANTRFMKEIGNKQIVYIDQLYPFVEAIGKTWSP